MTSKLECDVLTLCAKPRCGCRDQAFWKVTDENRHVVGPLYADQVFTGSRGTVCKEKRLRGWPSAVTLDVG